MTRTEIFSYDRLMDGQSSAKRSQVKLLDELKRRHTLEKSTLTPTQRFIRADEMRQLGRALARTRPLSGAGPDEPPELWLRMLRKFRALT